VYVSEAVEPFTFDVLAFSAFLYVIFVIHCVAGTK